MNCKLLFLTFCLLTGSTAFAQDSLQLFNSQRIRMERSGMVVLGSWATANIVEGTVGYYHSGGSTRYFNQMNIIWNIVNLGAATAGYLGSYNSNMRMSAAEILKKQRHLERAFLINGGLDVSYIGTGLIIHHAGNMHGSERQQGYGASIILQGAFLLLFDGTMYAAQKHNGSRLMRFITENQLLFDGKAVGMRLNF